MAWTQTEPTVKSWDSAQTTYWSQNNFNIKTTQSIGRTSGKGYAVKMVIVVTYTSSSFGNDIPLYLSCAGDSTTAYKATKKANTVTVYYTGEADAGVSITTIAGWTNSTSSQQTLTFTAPKLLGGQFYVNVNGSWKQATAYINVGGSWKEVTPKINVSGDWKWCNALY